MSVTITADKMLQIMDILRRNPSSLRPVPSTKKRNTDPVRMVAFQDVVKHGVPLVFTFKVGDKQHRLHLVDGYADSESPGAPIVGPYNAALKALGNSAVLSENAPFSEVCKAHRAIYVRVTDGAIDAPEGTKLVEAKTTPSKADVKKSAKVIQQPNPAAKAAPTPKEAKPVVTTESKKAAKEPLSRPYVWVKNGVEERITAKQWEQRLRMCGGLDRVPLGSGEVGDPFEMRVMTDDEVEQAEIEWADDIPVVVDIDPATPEFVTVIQQPSPEAKAKHTKAKSKAAKNAERTATKQQNVEHDDTCRHDEPVVKDLASALAILRG